MQGRIRPGTVATLLGVIAALSLSSAGQGAAQSADEGARVGQWKTWVLTSASEIAVPAPPADDSDQTKAELAELRALQALRSPILQRVVDYWNSGPATRHWVDLASRQPAPNAVRGNRLRAYVTAAMHDAVVAAYHAKYRHNRRPPGALATDLTPAMDTVVAPSYPSEHAAVATAAAEVLAYFNPAEAATFAALAQEAATSRLIAGANYRSDVAAGTALGKRVAEQTIARARSDGSDAPYTGTAPTGPQYWGGTARVEPTAGTWRTWILASGSQVRPGPPPAIDSARFKEDLAEVKRVTAIPTAVERAIALFWATEGLQPFWNALQSLTARDRVSTPRAARIAAFLNIAVWDATAAVWDSKFHYWHLRPNEADPTIVTVAPTPPYPAYAAGFPAAAAAMGEVLAHYFPQDAGRLRQMVEQAGLARVYQGVHYRHDVEASWQIVRPIVEMGIERDRMSDD